jgi:hypothetical protein
MAEDQNSRIAGTIMPDVDKVREQSAANFRATVIVELATISLLIDAGMTTTKAAIQRIEQIQNALSETFRSNEVSERVARVIHLLRDQDHKQSTV